MSDLKLTSPTSIKNFFNRHGLVPLKKRGQNFLCDPNIVGKIVDAVGVSSDDNVLEIGMGLGALTQALSQRAKKVVTVEIDRGILAYRKKSIENLGNVKVIEGDFLKQDLEDIWRTDFKEKPFYVCGNLPYYITGPLLLSVLESKLPIINFTAMVQKEVAERLIADPGSSEYSAVTACTQYFCKPEILFDVSRTCFYPEPNVDSTVVRMAYNNDVHPDAPYPAYREIVRNAFLMRRKTIANNLRGLIGFDQMRGVLDKLKINPGLRPQEISPDQYAEITRLLLHRGWRPKKNPDPVLS